VVFFSLTKSKSKLLTILDKGIKVALEKLYCGQEINVDCCIQIDIADGKKGGNQHEEARIRVYSFISRDDACCM